MGTTYRGEGKVIKRSGGVGQHGHCIIEIHAAPRGSTFEFTNAVQNGEVPKEFVPAILSGLREAMQEGYLAGYPIVDVNVTLTGGSCHEDESKANDFKMAAKQAFKDACSKAPMTILEPIGDMEVNAPAECVGAVIGDLNRRRARIKSIGEQLIEAEVPIAETFGYATSLRSLTQGRATFVLSLSGYDEVTNSIREQLIAG